MSLVPKKTFTALRLKMFWKICAQDEIKQTIISTPMTRKKSNQINRQRLYREGRFTKIFATH